MSKEHRGQPNSHAQEFVPPLPSRATRKFKRYNRGSGRARMVGGAVPTQMFMESITEKKAAYYLLSRPDVLDVAEQPTKLKFVTPEGEKVEHTFDLLVTMRCGRRILVAVKPKEIADRIGLSASIQHFATQTPRSLAHTLALLTDEHLGPDAIHDATLIMAVRRDPDVSHDAIVRSFVAGLIGTVAIGSVIEATRLGAPAFRSVVRLIGDGTLRVVGGSRIGYATRVALASSPLGRVA